MVQWSSLQISIKAQDLAFVFLDPVGSLVSTLLVGWWVSHTFSKFVNFECVGVLVCWCVAVLECWCVDVLMC